MMFKLLLGLGLACGAFAADAATYTFNVKGRLTAVGSDPFVDANLKVGDELTLRAVASDINVISATNSPYKFAGVKYSGLTITGPGVIWREDDDKFDGEPIFDRYGKELFSPGVVFANGKVAGLESVLLPAFSANAPQILLGSAFSLGDDDCDDVTNFCKSAFVYDLRLSSRFEISDQFGAYGNGYHTSGFIGEWDFANSSVTVRGTVPEPATWGLMTLGFGAIGIAARRRRSVAINA